jgi:alkylresorcinol/alkylpyrone synthase
VSDHDAPLPLVRPEVLCRTTPPGGPRILDRVGQALDFGAGDLATSRAVLADHGNCSSATIRMILEQVHARPMVSGANVVAIGFGPGLTAAAMLFRSG